jgi:uncharacterized SAM-binding protein YcdF (DUF218 family)
LHLTTALPLLVSGRHADYYYKLLHAAGVKSFWKEPLSTNTEQNAAYSACFLKQRGIDSVYVVTDDAHMARGLAWLRYYGLNATPASSGPPWPGHSSNPWLPSRIGWSRSKAVFHEWGGLAAFEVRRFFDQRLTCPPIAGPHDM